MIVVKRCYAAKVKAILRNVRQQVAAYLEDRPGVRAKTLALIVGKMKR